MSVQSMSWSIQQQLVKDPTSRHVLLCLSNYAGVDGAGAFPSTATLSRDTGLSERTIRTHLDRLLALGAILFGNQAIVAAWCQRADRRPTVYDIAIPRGAPDAPRQFVDKSVDKNGHGVQLTSPRGAAAAPKPKSFNRKALEPIDKRRKREAEGKGLQAASALLAGLQP